MGMAGLSTARRELEGNKRRSSREEGGGGGGGEEGLLGEGRHEGGSSGWKAACRREREKERQSRGGSDKRMDRFLPKVSGEAKVGRIVRVGDFGPGNRKVWRVTAWQGATVKAGAVRYGTVRCGAVRRRCQLV